jgi:hypothetical protein
MSPSPHYRVNMIIIPKTHTPRVAVLAHVRPDQWVSRGGDGSTRRGLASAQEEGERKRPVPLLSAARGATTPACARSVDSNRIDGERACKSAHNLLYSLLCVCVCVFGGGMEAGALVWVKDVRDFLLMIVLLLWHLARSPALPVARRSR